MEYIIRHTRKILATIIGFVVYLLGGFDTALQFFLMAVMFDVITGLLKAFVQGDCTFINFDSNVSYKGAVKKFGMFCMIGVITLVDRQQGAGGSMREVLLNVLIIHECISSLENLGSINVPLARKVKQWIEDIKKKLKEEINNW